MMPRLQVEIHGDVPSGFRREIEGELRECYRSLPASELQLVRICLFDTVERLREFKERERAQLGITTLGGEEFLATHDAWRGVPRITICLERINQVPALVRRGAIRHEVAHSILHGSPAFYTFKLSRGLLAKGRERGLDVPAMQQLLYFVAISVKDCEAVKLLLDHGYLDCQVALALYQMGAQEGATARPAQAGGQAPKRVDSMDRLAWLLARSDPPLRLIFLAAQLKPLLFICPILKAHPDLRFLEWKAQEMLSFLPAEERERLWRIARKVASRIGEAGASGETHRNVEMALWLVLEEL